MLLFYMISTQVHLKFIDPRTKQYSLKQFDLIFNRLLYRTNFAIPINFRSQTCVISNIHYLCYHYRIFGILLSTDETVHITVAILFRHGQSLKQKKCRSNTRDICIIHSSTDQHILLLTMMSSCLPLQSITVIIVCELVQV